MENGPSRVIIQMGQPHALQNNVPTSQVPSHGNIFSSDFHRNVPSHGDLTPSNSTPTSYSPTNSALTAHSPSPSKTTRRGRPPGSKNKPKEARVTKVTKKKGRPLGSKNKPKVPATNGNLTIESWEGAIDYSNNITEYPNYATNIHSAPLAIPQLVGHQPTNEANSLQPTPTHTPSQRNNNNPTNCHLRNCQCYTTHQHEPNAHGHRQHCPCLKCATDFPDVEIMGFADFKAEEPRMYFFCLDLETWRRANARGEREGRHISYEEQEEFEKETGELERELKRQLFEVPCEVRGD